MGLLNVEIFDALLEAKVLIERWRQHYNQRRPHSLLGYRQQAPEVIRLFASGSERLREEDEHTELATPT